jgi:hypothetical protein
MSTIDLVFVNEHYVSSFSTKVVPSLEAKHQFVKIILTNSSDELNKRSMAIRRIDTNSLDISDANTAINNMITFPTQSNVDTAYDTFINSIDNARMCSKSRSVNHWFDSECYALRRQVRDSYKILRYMPSSANRDKNSNLISQFQALRRKKNFEFENRQQEQIVAKAESDISQFWSALRTFKRKTPNMNVSLDTWHQHFSQLFKANVLPIRPTSYMHNYIDVLDRPFTVQELRKAINHGKYGKAAGPDMITYDLLKCSIDILLDPLLSFINCVFENQMCPLKWITSFLITLYKGKGPLSSPDSSRGIALQSCILKTYTYMLDQRLYSFSECNNLLPEEQHGFRKGRSTETAISYLNGVIQGELSSPKQPLYVSFVDFKKAFDSINRTILLQKLNMFGFSGNFINVLWSLLSENYLWQATTLVTR